jgi:hypothetical protein
MGRTATVREILCQPNGFRVSRGGRLPKIVSQELLAVGSTRLLGRM